MLLDSSPYKAVMGDSAAIAFSAPPPRAGMRRTVFLHSTGYYRPDVRSQGQPDTEALRQVFETPDGLARFAARRYAAWAKSGTPCDLVCCARGAEVCCIGSEPIRASI
jgi:hypothetical protein